MSKGGVIRFMKKTTLLAILVVLSTIVANFLWYGCGGDRLLNARVSTYHLEGFKITSEQQEYLDIETWNKYLNHTIRKFDEFEKWIWNYAQMQSGTVTITDSCLVGGTYYGYIDINLENSYDNDNYSILVQYRDADLSVMVNLAVTNVTSSGFRILGDRYTSLPYSASWLTMSVSATQ